MVAVYSMFADNNGAESVQWSQYIDQHIDKDSRRVDPQERPHTDLEYQAAFEVAQLGIASRVKRVSPRFRVVTPAHTSTSTWLDEHAGKLFDRYHVKDELEVELDTLLEKAHDNGKVAAYE